MQQDSIETLVAVINNNIQTIQRDLKEIKDKLEKDYVTQGEFIAFKESRKLIDYLVYGVAGLILTGFFLAVINSVIKP